MEYENKQTNKPNNPAVYRDGVLVFGVPCDTNTCLITSFFVNNFAENINHTLAYKFCMMYFCVLLFQLFQY